MQSKATITSQSLHYLPKKKSRLAYGGERVPVALTLRTERAGSGELKKPMLSCIIDKKSQNKR